MKEILEKLKSSFFIVNKLYLVLIFFVLAIEDLTLGFFYFLMSVFSFAWKALNSRVPINVSKKFEPKTLVYKKTKDSELKLDLWLPSKIK
ncbi:MAG: hypothetical protein WDA24_06275, partial [Tissierellales bacterium]